MTATRAGGTSTAWSRALTDRETVVLSALGRGEPYKAIAARLGISISTVNSYRRRALHKLGVDDVPRRAARQLA